MCIEHDDILLNYCEVLVLQYGGKSYTTEIISGTFWSVDLLFYV